jgi:hypothetical protein
MSSKQLQHHETSPASNHQPQVCGSRQAQVKRTEHVMAITPKLYPRATIKKIVKAHTKKHLSKNVDVLVFRA